jgi:ribosomal protein S18 acetylase RimI-like enzyme
MTRCTRYRRATERDLAGASQTHAEAFNDLCRRHGYPDQQYPTSIINPYFAFALEQSTIGFWVADTGGVVSGIGIASVFDGIWFLSHLFVHPEFQGRGIGRALLEKTLLDEDSAESTNHALVTMAYNPVSLGLYAERHLRPRELIYRVEAASESTTSACASGNAREVHEAGRAIRKALADLDRHTLGWSRDWQHRFFLSRQEALCIARYRRRHLDAYAYLWQDGRIGPAAGRTPEALRAIFDLGIRRVREWQPKSIATFVPGHDLETVALVKAAGMRIVLPFVLMTEKPIRTMSGSLLHSPGMP